MQNRQQIIIAGVLAIVLIGVLFYQFVLNKPKPPATPTAKTTTQADSSSSTPPIRTSLITSEITPSIDKLEEEVNKVIEELLKKIQIVQFNYQETPPLRNPMTPLVGVVKTSIFESEVPIPSTEVTPGQVLNKKISAIIWDEYQPLAIIDNQIVPEGYTFQDGIQVYDIEANRILFKLDDTIFPVRLKEQ